MVARTSLRTLKVSIEKENWADVREELQTSRGRESVTHQVYPDNGNRRAKLTALHLACRHGAPLDIVREMLTIRPDLVRMRSDYAGDVPLHYAVFRLANNPTFSTETVEYLVRVCPESVSIRSGRAGAFGNAVHPLHVAVLSSASPNLMELLLEACPSAKNKNDGHGRKPHGIASQTNLCYHHREPQRQLVLKILEPDPSLVQRMMQCILFAALYAVLCTSISLLRTLLKVVDRSHIYYLLILCETAAVFYFVDVSRFKISEWMQSVRQQFFPTSMAITPTFSLEALQTATPEIISRSLAQGGLGLCIICWDKPVSHVLVPCGHVCLCVECASDKCIKDIVRCPVGKCSIQNTMKVYVAGVSR